LNGEDDEGFLPPKVLKYCPCLKVDLTPYFDVSTQDIKKRLIASLLPYNQRFYEEYQQKPDLYGPFWIIWTLVVILCLSANLERYMQFESKEEEEFTYTFKVIPVAISVLFGVIIGLPVIIKTVVRFMGSKQSDVTVISAIGMYGYSFSSFLITCTLCGVITNQIVQWILILYSMVTSIMFLITTYWADLSTTLESSVRLWVVGGIVLSQIALLLVFKLYFFHHVSAGGHAIS